MVGFRKGWTMIVSSSTEVASVTVASLLEDGARLGASEPSLEVEGERL